MSSNPYEIRLVERGDFPRVAELLRHLTGAVSGWNLTYLKWKYLDNPYVEAPLGIVTVLGSEVVGFRGYHATPWYRPDCGHRTIVLTPGDTCVDPGHRRSGLSVKMGRTAMRELYPDYRVFLNMTAGASSVPGYLRMGFVPLRDKSYMTLTSLWRLGSHLVRGTESPLAGVEFGDFGDIVVSPEPQLEDLGRVAMDPAASEARLTAFQDHEFFRWYFRAPRTNHVFYYARENGNTTGYVVLRVADNGQLAFIIDYSRQSFPAVAAILRFLKQSRPFGLVWIYCFTPDPEVRQLLHTLGFRSDGWIERLRRRMKRVWPLLVRPVKEHPGEEDWFVEGLDIRVASNWEIKEISSDAI